MPPVARRRFIVPHKIRSTPTTFNNHILLSFVEPSDGIGQGPPTREYFRGGP